MVTLKFPSEAVCFSNVSLTKLGKFPEIDRANSLDIMSSGRPAKARVGLRT